MERLNKYLAHAGVGSRRHCEELIVRGRVTVDGQVVRELGTKVEPGAQAVAVDGQPLHVERSVYWLVNKPRGYLCTNHDPARRPLAKLNHKVLRLKRIAIGSIIIGRLGSGKSRPLRAAEVERLQHACERAPAVGPASRAGPEPV